MISSWILPEEKEAEQFASDMDWRYVDENQFEWRLAFWRIEEDVGGNRRKTGNRKTATRRKWRLKASPMRSASILASRPEKTASAILQAGARARS